MAAPSGTYSSCRLLSSVNGAGRVPFKELLDSLLQRSKFVNLMLQEESGKVRVQRKRMHKWHKEIGKIRNSERGCTNGKNPRTSNRSQRLRDKEQETVAYMIIKFWEFPKDGGIEPVNLFWKSDLRLAELTRFSIAAFSQRF